jgi:hypothetical protein
MVMLKRRWDQETNRKLDNTNVLRPDEGTTKTGQALLKKVDDIIADDERGVYRDSPAILRGRYETIKASDYDLLRNLGFDYGYHTTGTVREILDALPGLRARIANAITRINVTEEPWTHVYEFEETMNEVPFTHIPVGCLSNTEKSDRPIIVYGRMATGLAMQVQFRENDRAEALLAHKNVLLWEIEAVTSAAVARGRDEYMVCWTRFTREANVS